MNKKRSAKSLDKSLSASQAARQIIRAADKAYLNTIANPEDSALAGWPVASMVTLVSAWSGAPVLMLSDIAYHSQNIAADNRCSLLFDGSQGFANPQEGPRVNVIGQLEKTSDKKLAARFLKRHPGAQLYADFSDFNFYQMKVEKFHFVGGFAQAVWLSPRKAVLTKAAWSEIAASEQSILDHMNADHGAALQLYGTKLLRQRGKHWQMIGLDPEGCDLKCGQTIHRLNFKQPITSAAAARKIFVELVEQAKNA